MEQLFFQLYSIFVNYNFMFLVKSSNRFLKQLFTHLQPIVDLPGLAFIMPRQGSADALKGVNDSFGSLLGGRQEALGLEDHVDQSVFSYLLYIARLPVANFKGFKNFTPVQQTAVPIINYYLGAQVGELPDYQ